MQTCISVLIASLCLILSHAAAATIAVTGDSGDGMVDVNGVALNLTDPMIRPGTGGNDVRGQAGVFFFQLPTLSPNAIASADVQLSFLGLDVAGDVVNVPDFNLDLFGLGVRSSATILSSDYYAGNAAGGNGTLIESAFLTPGASPGNFDASFGGYLQSLYSPSGVPLGDFLVVRLNPSIPLPSFSFPERGYNVATADNSNSSLLPELTINSVPEPSSLALGILAGLTLLAFGANRTGAPSK